MFYFPVYALYHYYPETFWFRITMTTFLLFGGIVSILLLYKKRKIVKRNPVWWIMLWGYTIFILYITVFGRYTFDDYRARLIPFESYRMVLATGSMSELRGIILNVLLFVPLGFLSALCFQGKKPVLIALFVSLILTVSIELLQYVTTTGTLETDDMMHNMIGATIGVGIWTICRRILRKTDL